jgi:hypothetical protein
MRLGPALFVACALYAQAEIWRYNLGPTKFPAILRIVDGAVESITFEKSHG